jgi:DNA polymerase III subunit delta'
LLERQLRVHREANLQSFCTLSSALRTLIDDFTGERIPHATLLTGAPGIGKRTLARLLVQSSLCTSETCRPCGECRSCRRIFTHSHPNLLMPDADDKDKSIKADHMRAITGALSHYSMEEGRRAVLIEGADRMTAAAQNALLKSLEEPDDETLFILTSDSEQKLLPTVRSRCRVIRMQPWPDDRVLQLMTDNNIEPARARELTLLCSGSPGHALKMHGDDNFWKLRDLVYSTFFSVKSPAEIPAASAALKDQKEAADTLLAILEQQTRLMLAASMGAAFIHRLQEAPAHLAALPPESFRRILSQTFEAQRFRASYVNWQAVAERLLSIITEEIIAWRQS